MTKINLQFFGGRGGISGLSNIVKFPSDRQTKPTQNNTTKWDYRGYVEAVNNIEKAVNEANTRKKVETAYKGIINQERNVSAEITRIERGEKDTGDINVLLTQRRRLRQLKAKLNKKEIL